jgi:hypothetical protein
MKLKDNVIGSKCWSSILSRMITIEAGKEDYYLSLGFFDLFIYTKPKLVKHVETRKESISESDSNSN